ncbi:MAG: molybdenum cofactor guanylyltransferase [Planctomycetota bacterium]|jgi:molybdopterin-guanine dinucleotide biosynthesis protein A
MIKIPGMIMIGAGDRDVGKTEFACSLIRKFGSRHNIIGIKVTTIEHANDNCPRGGEGCGVCATLEGNFCITEETNRQSNKDTCRMLAAGAKKVFWLRVLKNHLKDGINALQAAIGTDAISVCESNSLRLIAEPGLFFMFKAVDPNNCKPSAAGVEKYSDRTVLFDGRNFDISLDEIELMDGKWVHKMAATAIIMAGGRSRRMGQDKAVLEINGTPAIQYVFDQLRPYFDQILISSNNMAEHSLIGAETVPDEVADKGPLMGIASALRVSRNDTNFVIACDIPEVNIDFVRRMIRESKGFDAVVPQTKAFQYEPLFAVYKKSVLAEIEKAIDSGKYRVIAPLENCKVKYLELNGDMQLRNLNTMNDYCEFVGNDTNVNI